MKTLSKSNCCRRGVAYVLALLLLAIFSTLALAFAATTDLGLRKNENWRRADEARLAAESGMAFWTYTLGQMQPPDDAEGSALVRKIADTLALELNQTPNIKGATLCYAEESDTITAPEILLNEGGGFSAAISLDAADKKKIHLTVVGRAGTFRRTVRMAFRMRPKQGVTFDYGVAAKGSIIMQGQAQMLAIDDPRKADMFTSYDGDDQPAIALSGQVSVSGEVFASNPDAEINVDPSVSISGQSDIDVLNSPYVHVGVPDIELPKPDLSVFEPFVTNIMNDSGPSAGTYTNIRIPADTNPTFSADTVLEGVIIVEKPNNVSFAGKVTIRGVIVTEDDEDSTGGNTIKFSGQVDSYAVDTLPDEPQFEGIKQIPGVFLLMPGFDVSFTGQFGIVNGAIMADSVTLAGQAGGTIMGPVICYEGDFRMSGLGSLTVNRSGSSNLPSCFNRPAALIPLPETYVEQ